jgi:hypothetical protein
MRLRENVRASARRPQGQRQAAAGERQGQRQETQGQRQDAAGERQGERGDNRDENREDWQEHQKDLQEDRQDFAEDELDDWDDHWHDDDWDDHWDDDAAEAFIVGAAIGATVGVVATAASQPTYVTTVTTLPCTGNAVIINGVSYYQCGTTWYNRGYQGSTVVYMVTTPPPGF